MDAKNRNELENRLFSQLWKKSLDNMFILRVIDNDFYIISTNEAQQEAVSIKALEHFNKPLREVLPKELYNFVAPNYQKCKQQQTPIQYEESEAFTSSDGSVRHWSTMLSPINNKKGNTEYIFGISRNITELTNAKQSAENSAKEAEKANQVKTTFLANMSHEMRTPLNGIQCAVELLKEVEDEREKIELLNIIESSAEALSKQTSDILLYAKIGRGKISLQNRNFSPIELVDAVIRIVSYSAAIKKIQLNVEVDKCVPVLVNGDPDRIKQVLLNVVNNAIKFTCEGSISISLKHDDTRQQLQFSVIDTGIGILESDQEKLFKPFSQIDDSATRQFEGNGLGLVISKELVQLMQGEIKLTSRVGVGSECQFTITYETAVEVTEPEQPPHVEISKQIHILIVEDNSTNQIVLQKILTQAGISITLVNDGQQALDVCKNTIFDIILMDWHMPVLDGLEATKALRKTNNYANTPILGLTASVMEEDIKACIEAGMNDVMAKPIKRESLFNAIAKYTKFHPQVNKPPP